MMTTVAFRSVDASTDERSELARRHLCGIDLMQGDITGRDERADLYPDPTCPLDDALGPLVKGEEGGALALFYRIVCDAEGN